MCASRRRIDQWKADPFLPPDWRWREAGQIARGESSRLGQGTDAALRAAVVFRKGREPPETCRGRRRRGLLQEIATAVALHDEEGPKLWEVRARLLSGQSDDEIAAKCSMAPATVRLYEQFFFCV